jgi:hypothetical protein
VAPVEIWDVEDYEAIEQNLEGLTADVPDITIGEILRCYHAILWVCLSLSVDCSVG